MSAPSNSDDFAEGTEDAQPSPVNSDAAVPPVTSRTRGRGGGERTNIEDYREIYPDDPYGAEAGQNARVWRVYLDETEQFDNDMIQGFRDTLDVHLVFAALFSAVVTTFLVQTSQSLQPDYGRISAALLLELVALQRSSSLGDVPSAGVGLESVSYSASDVWINALWSATLALSLATVLVAALVKQWLQEYVRMPSGTARDRALKRQLRHTALLRWKVPLIINSVPLLLHISLALFLAGFVVFLDQISALISSIVVVLTGLTYAFYLGTHVLAVVYWQSSYRTPITRAARDVLLPYLVKQYNRINEYIFDEGPSRSLARFKSSLAAAAAKYPFRRIVAYARVYTRGLASLQPLAMVQRWWLGPRKILQAPVSFETAEVLATGCGPRASLPVHTMLDCMKWLHRYSSNPSTLDIICDALAGWPAPLSVQNGHVEPSIQTLVLGLLELSRHRLDISEDATERDWVSLERFSRAVWCVSGLAREHEDDLIQASLNRFVEDVILNVNDKIRGIKVAPHWVNTELLGRLGCLHVPRALIQAGRLARDGENSLVSSFDPFHARCFPPNPGMKLALITWNVLLQTAYQSLSRKHSLVQKTPLQIHSASGMARKPTGLAEQYLDSDSPGINERLPSVLQLAWAFSSSEEWIPLAQASPYTMCEGGVTLATACRHHPNIRELLQKYLGRILQADHRSWPHCLANLMGHMWRTGQPMPDWLSKECRQQYQQETQFSQAFRRVHTILTQSLTNIADAIDSTRHAICVLERVLVIHGAARNLLSRDHPHHAFRCSDVLPSDTSTAPPPLLFYPIMSIFDLSLQLYLKANESEPLVDALAVCNGADLLGYLKYACDTPEAICEAQMTMTGYIRATLCSLELPWHGQSMDHLLADDVVEWMVGLCLPRLRTGEVVIPTCASLYLTTLRCLHRRTAEHTVWRDTLLRLVSRVQEENAARQDVASWDWESYLSLSYFAAAIEMQDELHMPEDHPYPSLQTYVSVDWMIGAGNTPRRIDGDLVYGPYAVPFDASVELGNTEDGNEETGLDEITAQTTEQQHKGWFTDDPAANSEGAIV
ncbi:hypothetical protein GGG16DRAFT_121144 [Schizophyllum commune]